MAGRASLDAAAVASEPSDRFRLCFPLLFSVVATLSYLASAAAEIRMVTAQGEHRMGDRDTREDAVRLATEAAKRDALEQVATYLESVTVVEGMDVTRDEIRTYTAGLVVVLDQQTNLMLDGDTVVVKIDLTAQVDTEDVAQAISALKDNEDARHQLVALKLEIDSLHQELETVNQALAQASTFDQIQQASQQRQDLLNRAQSNAMVSQAWTDWVLVSPAVSASPWVDVAQTQALLNVARGLYPTSPHVQAAQQVITTSGAPQISSSAASRTLSHVRQLNALLPFATGAPPATQQTPLPGSRSARALHQFLQPPAAAPGAGQSPVPRRLSPTVNQLHPPLLHQVPRVPYHIAPRGFGGRGHGGGSGGRGGGRGR
jgi:hypothetical protein